MFESLINNSIVTFIIGAVAGYFINIVVDLLWKRIKSLPAYHTEHKKTQYEQITKGSEFFDFETEVLKKYYGEEYFTDVFNRLYPVFCISGKDVYPFTKLCENGFDRDKHLEFEKNRFYKEYYSIVKDNIRRPKMQGFMLDSFLLNSEEKIIGMNTWVGTYDENIYTSHILEYEIYKEYLNCKKTGDQFQKDHFTLRNKIHCNEDIKSILVSGKGRVKGCLQKGLLKN